MPPLFLPLQTTHFPRRPAARTPLPVRPSCTRARLLARRPSRALAPPPPWTPPPLPFPSTAPAAAAAASRRHASSSGPTPRTPLRAPTRRPCPASCPRRGASPSRESSAGTPAPETAPVAHAFLTSSKARAEKPCASLTRARPLLAAHARPPPGDSGTLARPGPAPH